MSQPLILGITGRARSGKDTLARLLQERHGFTPIAFADQLRAAAYALDPLVPNPEHPDYQPVRLHEIIDAYGWEEAKDRFPEVRRTLQRLGTEAGWQVHGRNLWVNAAEHTFRAIRQDNPQAPVVFTDVRFIHEAQWIESQGGCLVQIHRPSAADLHGDLSRHPSETSLLSADHFIDNSGPLSALPGQVEQLLQSL